MEFVSAVPHVDILELQVYDRPDQLQRDRTPNLETSRKTAEKGARWVRGRILYTPTPPPLKIPF